MLSAACRDIDRGVGLAGLVETSAIDACWAHSERERLCRPRKRDAPLSLVAPWPKHRARMRPLGHVLAFKGKCPEFGDQGY